MNMPKPKFLIYDGFQDDTIVVIFVKKLKGSCCWAILPSIMHIIYKGKHTWKPMFKINFKLPFKFPPSGLSKVHGFENFLGH